MAITEGQPTRSSKTDQAGEAYSIREAASILRLVSDTTRLHIIGILATGERTASELSSMVSQSLPAVSHHLAMLRVSGLIAPHRKGRRHYYRLTELCEPLLQVIGASAHVASGSHEREPLAREGAVDLVIESTKGFEADMDRLPAHARSKVASAINARCQLILTDRRSFEADLSQPYKPLLAEGLESTLYVMRIHSNYRIILAVDDDPLFGRIVITLMRIIEKRSENAAYRAVASMLYEGI